MKKSVALLIIVLLYLNPLPVFMQKTNYAPLSKYGVLTINVKYEAHRNSSFSEQTEDHTLKSNSTETFTATFTHQHRLEAMRHDGGISIISPVGLKTSGSFSYTESGKDTYRNKEPRSNYDSSSKSVFSGSISEGWGDADTPEKGDDITSASASVSGQGSGSCAQTTTDDKGTRTDTYCSGPAPMGGAHVGPANAGAGGKMEYKVNVRKRISEGSDAESWARGENWLYLTSSGSFESGQYHFSFSGSRIPKDEQLNEPNHKITFSESVTVEGTISLGSAKPSPAEMEIAPENAADYDKWMPVPVSADDDKETEKLYGGGQKLTFKVTLKSKDAKNPRPPTSSIDFYLQDVSSHKGRSGNEGDKDEPDLKFSKDQSGDVKIDPNDPKHASIENEVSEAVIEVEATDTGAYGKLVARADELGLTATYKRTGENFVPLPRDDNNNDIADEWEKKGNTPSIFEKNYPANWDEEDAPQTHSKGDGLTLYEEYRGFVLDMPDGNNGWTRRWQRVSPARKKLFVNVSGVDKELFRQGALGFQTASGIQVYFLHSADDLKLDENHQPRVQEANNSDPNNLIPEIIYPKLLPRWLNFNSDTDDGKDFGGRQYAVNITNWDLPQEPGVYARTPAIEGVGDFDSAPPELTQAVYVFRKNTENIVANLIRKEFPKDHPEKIWKGWFDARDKIQQTRGITISPLLIHDYIEAHYSEMVNRLIVFSVIHELAHSTGMFHHSVLNSLDGKGNTDFASGDADCPMFYWDSDKTADLQLLFYSGNWNPATGAASGKPWKYDNGKDCLQSCRLHKDK